MTKNVPKITVLSLLAAAFVAMPALSRAQDAGTNAPASSGQTTMQPKLKKLGTLPFRGKLSAVDTNAMTLTVGKLTIQITSDTKITKDDQPATLSDGVVGESVGGAYKKTDDGKLDAMSVHFGVKAEKKTKAVPDAGNTTTGN